MGKSQSTLTAQKELESVYKYIRRYSNGCYGQLTVIEKKNTKKLFALKQFITETQNIDKKLEDRKNQSHKNVIKLIDYYIKDENSLCSNLKQVYLIFQYEETTLQDQIFSRQPDQKFFSFVEIQNMITSIVSALMHFDQSNITHTGLSLKSIIYTKQCQLKLLEPEIVSLYTNRNQYIIQSSYNNYTYQPPQIINLSQSQITEIHIQKINFSKASVFSLGILFLGICFLNDSIQDEILTNGQYDYYQIKKLIRLINDKYNNFGDIILRMVSNQPEKRPTYSEIYNLVAPKNQKQNIGTNNIFKQIKNSKNIVESKIIPSKKIF